VIRALRHLNGLAVDGQDLLVKCSAATQQYADEYLARKVHPDHGPSRTLMTDGSPSQHLSPGCTGSHKIFCTYLCHVAFSTLFNEIFCCHKQIL